MKYQMLVDGDRVKVRKVDHQGAWGTVIADSNGRVFASVLEASKASGLHRSTLLRAIENGEAINGVLFAFATPSETQKRFDIGDIEGQLPRVKKFVAEKLDEGVLKPKADTAPVPLSPVPLPPRTTTSQAPPAALEPQFWGVKWPDGNVTIRLISDPSLWMTRAHRTEFPAEIMERTKWL